MRNADLVYTDILPSNLNDYIGIPDESHHKLEATTGPAGELRYNVLIWLLEE